MCVCDFLSVCVHVKVHSLLLGQLFVMPGPHSWLQTQPGCCLSVSSQPGTRPAKSYLQILLLHKTSIKYSLIKLAFPEGLIDEHSKNIWEKNIEIPVGC